MATGARTFKPKKATRKGQRLRLSIDGPTGSGKTWTGLQMATVLAEGNPICLIDTERGSSGLYGDTYDFDIVDFDPPYDPRDLRSAIRQLSDEYAVIIVDSLSHFWLGEGGTMDIVDNANKRSNNPNKFAGWAEGTPAQRDMVDALLSANCHIITTMRSKMAYALDEKNRPTKVGLAPEQRAGIEYEFTVVVDMDLEHTMTVSKSRCDAIADKVYKAGHTDEMAEVLSEWLSSNEAMISADQINTLRDLTAPLTDGDKKRVKELFKEHWGVAPKLTAAEATEAIEWITEMVDGLMADTPAETQEEE